MQIRESKDHKKWNRFWSNNANTHTQLPVSPHMYSWSRKKSPSGGIRINFLYRRLIWRHKRQHRMDINSDRVECVHFTSKRIVKKAEADNNTFSLTTALIVKLLSHYRCRGTFYSDAYAFTHIHIAHATHLLGDAPPRKNSFRWKFDGWCRWKKEPSSASEWAYNIVWS